jgi:hypothetical protein
LISTNCPEVLSSAGKALFIDAVFLVAAPSASATARTSNSQQSVLKKRLVDTNWSNGQDKDQDQDQVGRGGQQSSSPSKSKKPSRVSAADADSVNPPDSTSVSIQKNSAIGSRCLEIDITDVRYRKDTRPLVRISGICDSFISIYI